MHKSNHMKMKTWEYKGAKKSVEFKSNEADDKEEKRR